jgi:glycosyltransferase involved in cell wall biosynthesis
MARSFASMLNIYLNNVGDTKRDGEMGRAMTSTFYNWDKICEQYYNIFID